MEFPALWLAQEDAIIAGKFGRALLRNARLGLCNTEELLRAEYKLRDATGNFDGPWLAGYPLPVAGLPDRFAPDFWSFGRYDFASRRLRDALAQPEDVVQFLPFNLVQAGAAARAQDYCWMRVVVHQEALDIDRCDCRITMRTHAITGKPRRSLSNIKLLALRQDLTPRTGIFRLEESPTYIYATDAVAERVLRAGCTGMEFCHPENRLGGMRIERYRILDGIAERRVHFLD